MASFYLDALELGNYWACYGEPRRYHHTGIVSLVYALREALAAIAKEGIDESVKRHQQNAQVLYKLLKDSGFELFVQKEVRPYFIIFILYLGESSSLFNHHQSTCQH